MTRRNLELLLLIVAAPLVVLLFIMLAVNEGLGLSMNTLGVPIGLFAAFIVAHLAIRKLTPGADPAILPLAFALSGIGIAFVTRLAPDLAVRQVVWLFLSIAVMVVVLIFVRNPDRLANYKYTLMLVGVALLLSPLLPGIGTDFGQGSRIWISLGPISFQPGEIAKLCIVLFFAGYLAQNREMLSVFTWEIGPFRLPDLRAIAPLLFMWALAMVVVIFERDLGSAALLFFLFLIMLYVSTGKKFYLVVGLVLAGIAVVALYFLFSHVQVRVDTWLDPFADAQNTGYQLTQAIYSLADGGLFGVGIGRGFADVIPIVESDFIFVAIAEEAGLLGAAGVLLLYLCFSIRGLVTAARAKSDVSSFIAVGMTTSIVLQAFIIVGGVTRLIPLTGITLPFIAQGGSSLLASFAIVAFLLRCGDEGTGVEREMKNATSLADPNSVLGRVSLGKRLTNTMIIFSVLFAVLVANLTYIMVIKASDYQNMPGNSHVLMREARTQRGTISTADGVVLAESVPTGDGGYERVYPAGDLASQVVGYTSQRFGQSGIEASMNEALTGQESYATWEDAIKVLAGTPTPGNDVTLTINSEIQEAAQDALAGSVGACVVMDPNTGAVLAMATSPTYNAADFESVIEAASAESNGNDEASVLLNRATQALYAPGSTFKMITLATALQDNVATENTTFDSPATIDIGNAPVTNYHNNSYGTITLREATMVSSNTVFGQVGALLGPERLVKGADAFGFNHEVPFELPLLESLMPNPSEMTEWETAWAADGMPVGEHESPAGPQSTVLEMALAGCAIANDGLIMQPYLVEGIYNAEGVQSFSARPSRFLEAVSAATAERVRDVLADVVAGGTGTAAALPDVTVAGKTGTAERGDGTDNSWFVGMAPANDARVVVSIVVEKGDSGTGAARAHDVLATALRVTGGQ